VTRSRRELPGACVALLQPPIEHRPIVLAEHVGSNVHAVVRAHAEDVHVVRRVMDLAEGETVGDLGEAAFVAVLEDVRGVEEILVPEPADGAARATGVKPRRRTPREPASDSDCGDGGGMRKRRSRPRPRQK